MSLAEDVAVVGGTWLAVQYPLLFLCLLLVFLIGAIMLLRLLLRGLRRLLRVLAPRSSHSL